MTPSTAATLATYLNALDVVAAGAREEVQRLKAESRARAAEARRRRAEDALKADALREELRERRRQRAAARLDADLARIAYKAGWRDR